MSAIDQANRIGEALDRSAALALLRQALRIESITGNEADFSAFLSGQMQARGFDVESAEFLPGRPNVWGHRRGQGRGPHLLIIGHTDTVRVDGWREKWAGTGRENPWWR